ncbi:MAG: NnrU family protein [Wenzhouxiangellaceae bacterium]|nr:NnrU family protein [Wenzhouxiangellaceae bacterium]
MTLLIVGLILFLGSHSLSIVAPAARNAWAARLGEWPFKGLYGLIALTGFVLLVIGYGQARLDPTVLYVSPSWTTHLMMLLMLIVFPALFATYLPGRISRMLGHPMLVAVKAWAIAHLLVNGTLADVLLFGGFLAWAVADRISLKRRTPNPILRAPETALNDVLVIVLGLAAYVGFAFWAHPRWIGVPVMSIG